MYKPDPTKPDADSAWKARRRRSSNAVRSLLDTKYSNEYDVDSGSDNSLTLTMKPTVVKALEEKTVQQAIETIRDRVNALGVSEPVIQEYSLGANQILVELPGVSELRRDRRTSSSPPPAWRFTPLSAALIRTSRLHWPAWAAPCRRTRN